MAKASRLPEELVYSKVLVEREQSHPTRRRIFTELKNKIDRPIVSYFTSFRYPVSIEDDDAEMLEGILQKMDLSKGLALFISSPGGDGLAAERIVNVCRNYSGTGEYWAIVLGKAKSAATLVCFGASKILMSASSELGPVDPQHIELHDKEVRRFSVFNIVESYDDLFKAATKTKGNLEPFLQQLQRYDARQIQEFRSDLLLSSDLAIKSLKTGMLKGQSAKAIQKKIDIFLTPTRTKSHGRPIYAAEAKKCGLKIDVVDTNNPAWSSMYELYVRTSQFVSTKVAKCIENEEHSLFVSP